MPNVQTSITPLPGFGVALIDSSQMDNVEFEGDDKFDLPQSGILLKLTEQDAKRALDDDGSTYKSLIGKRICWAKYAESDALFFDNNLSANVVIIALDKLRGTKDD